MAACLMAAAGLVITAPPAHNGSPVARRPEPARLLATLTTGAWTGATGAWSGYVVKSGTSSDVSAKFTVPAALCPTGLTGPQTSFWAGIQSWGSNGASTLVQDGISLFCANGQPSYWAWMVADAYSDGRPVILLDPVQPNDVIMAFVYTDSVGNYTLVVADQAENWLEYRQTTGNPPSNDYAAVGAESFDGGVNFSPVAVTNAEVNNAPIGQSHYEADEQGPSIYNGTAGLDPSALDAAGQDFNFYWNAPPGLITHRFFMSSGPP